jgi:hypothetical protein
MSLRLRGVCISFVSLLWLAGSAEAGARVNAEYSADQTIETVEGLMKARIFSTPTKERREMEVDGATMVIIARHDKKVVWNLMPDDKMYMEMKVHDGSEKKDDLSSYEIEQTPMGEETLDGRTVNKSKIVMTGSDGMKMGGFMWTTAEGIVVKLDAIAVEDGQKDRFKMEQRNIKVGKQADDLFEIPPGYEKLGFGMDMMQGLMGR